MNSFSPESEKEFINKFKEFHKEKEKIERRISSSRRFSSLFLVFALVVFALGLLTTQWLHKVFLLEVGVLLLSIKMVLMIEEQNKSHHLQLLLAEALELSLETLLNNLNYLVPKREEMEASKSFYSTPE